jgi:serine/threonine protein phosphatase PrpC
MATRDHIEIELSESFAAVTDRGVRHSENQDAVAIQIVHYDQRTTYIAVACDGVSGSEGAAEASSTAATTTCAVIEQGILADPETDMESLVARAIHEANDAVGGISYSHGTAKDPPETTIVIAVVTGLHAVIGWAGDSRAYCITDDSIEMLTKDHSWVNDVVDAGLLTEEVALKSPMAHAIVRCLGGSTSSQDDVVVPSIITRTLPEKSQLLLCSDGLWNYLPSNEDVANLYRDVESETPLERAVRLVKFAIARGGKDNITTAILKVTSENPEPQISTPTL